MFGYKVLGVIGHGAASTIYRVSDRAGQVFALKHVIKKIESDDRFLRQLQNEYDVSQKFRHHALRKAVDWKVPRRFFSNKFDEAALVLEWIDGQPLDQSVPGDLPTLVSTFVQAGAALASMHRLKLVHCDFKPHNVLRCQGDKVKVIDFGQTCKVGYGKNRVQGTPDFIAPEQVKCQAVDEKTDIYSFGASLYWALTGNRVPTYFTVEKKDHDVVKFQEFPSPMELNKTVPAELSNLVMQCLMYSPDRRPADMITALNALSSSLTAAPRG